MARLLGDGVGLGALLVVAVAARLGRKACRRINRTGMAGWAIVLALTFLVVVTAIELIEFV